MHSRKRPHSISGVWEEIVGEIISLIHPKWGQENMHGVGHNKGLSTCMYLNKYMKENEFETCVERRVVCIVYLYNYDYILESETVAES